MGGVSSGIKIGQRTMSEGVYYMLNLQCDVVFEFLERKLSHLARKF